MARLLGLHTGQLYAPPLHGRVQTVSEQSSGLSGEAPAGSGPRRPRPPAPPATAEAGPELGALMVPPGGLVQDTSPFPR